MENEAFSSVLKISIFYFPVVKAAILNVEVGTMFDPELASKLKQSEETCVKCSQRINDLVERPVDFSNDEDVEMK